MVLFIILLGEIINSIYDPLDDKGIDSDFVFLENESALMNITNPFFTNDFAILAINKCSFPNN